MLLIQLSILVVAVFTYGEKPLYITYSFLYCLYLIYTKSYKWLPLLAFSVIAIEFDQWRFQSFPDYKNGDAFEFSFHIDETLAASGSNSLTFQQNLSSKYSFPLSSVSRLLQNTVQVHMASQSFNNSFNGQKRGIEGKARINRIIYAAPQGSWRQKYLFRQGIRAELWLDSPSVIYLRQGAATASPLPIRLKQTLRQFYTHLPSWRFSQSLLFGDKSDLLDSDMWLVRFLGLSHLFVVSGLHVGFIYLLLKGVCYCLWRSVPSVVIMAMQSKQRLQLLCVTPCTLFYGYLTGWHEPVQRAIVMLLLWLIGKSINLKFSSMNVLFTALLFICLLSPRSILSPSLWLSFCLVFLLIAYYYGRKKSWQDWFKIQILLTLAATSLTLGWQPSISLLSIPTNLFIIPFTAFIWFPVLVFACLETLLFESVYLMSALDHLLSYLFIMLDYIGLYLPSLSLKEDATFALKLCLFIGLVIWVLYERVNNSAALLLVFIFLLLSTAPIRAMFIQLARVNTTVWYVEHDESGLRVLDAKQSILINSHWANHVTELEYYRLDLLMQKSIVETSDIKSVSGQITRHFSSVFIWPMGNRTMTVKLMKNLAPVWLLLKEEPDNKTRALLSALSIHWLVLLKGQTLKIEFWQDDWYIEHSACSIIKKLQQEKNCQRVAQLESVIN